MLDHLVENQSARARHRATVFGPYLDDYLEGLYRFGYRHKVLRRNLSMITRFGEHMAEQGVYHVSGMSSEHVETFLECEKSRMCSSRGTVRQASLVRQVLGGLWQELEGRGVLRAAEPAARARGPVDEFYHSLTVERGIQPCTIAGYRRFVDQFLRHVGRDGSPASLSRLTLQDVDGFIVVAGRKYSRTSMRQVCTAIRGLLRHLFRIGLLDRDLATAVVQPWFYALERLPCALPWETVRRVLDVVDQTTATGRRDRAILLLLLTYGVRPGEVVKLHLHDINWRRDVIRFQRSKNGRPLSFPLTREVGEAIVAYLRHGRPPTADDEVFIRMHAPHVALAHGSSVSAVVRRYMDRAGIQSRHTGAYVIRHSLAVHLVRKRHPLKSVTDMLGHRDPGIAYQYAKLDTEDLRSVALEIREVLP